MQKFTEEEAADYQAKYLAAVAELDAKYQPEIEGETARSQKIIEEAAENIKKAKPPTQAARKGMSREELKTAVEPAEIAAKRVPEWKSRMADARHELLAYEKQMADTKAREARQLLKERFDYPIFLYDAAQVGITATGEQDVCELYHSETLGLPAGVQPEDTALEQYRGFREQPERFIVTDRAQN
jgi:type I restriction enzyme M protein